MAIWMFLAPEIVTVIMNPSSLGSIKTPLEEKILSMYAKGKTTGDIESHMKELYDIDISDSTISRITDRI